MRIEKGKLHFPSVRRGASVTLEIDGQSVAAYEGETIAAVMQALGLRTFRHARKTDEPRGMFCGMGICQECRVTVNGIPNIRACMTSVTSGMVIETERKVQ